MDTEELLIWRAIYKLYMDFQLHGGSNPYVVQGPNVYLNAPSWTHKYLKLSYIFDR